ncbi:MAG: ABC transporter ATP-binding protein [Candidatus Neomarinimicrobiota bacterium]
MTARGTMEPVIQIEGLSKTYRNRRKTPVQAVKDLSLSVDAGQIFGFLGPNGAGKTTTIKMICGLVTADAGSVRVNGRDTVDQRSAVMKDIGVVLEGTRNVYWRLSAWENLMYFGRLKGKTTGQLRERGERLLRELDIWERRKETVRTFSRGMQQKVAIASALIADPPVVLLDEPTLGLDVPSARTVKRWVARLAGEEGKTVILTTHQLQMAEELCDRVAIMQRGELLANEPVDKLLELSGDRHYRIRLEGELPDSQLADFPGLDSEQENGTTILSGPIPTQEELFRVLDKVKATGLPLHSVRRTEVDLEEVFVRMLAPPDAGQAEKD